MRACSELYFVRQIVVQILPHTMGFCHEYSPDPFPGKAPDFSTVICRLFVAQSVTIILQTPSRPLPVAIILQTLFLFWLLTVFGFPFQLRLRGGC